MASQQQLADEITKLETAYTEIKKDVGELVAAVEAGKQIPDELLSRLKAVADDAKALGDATDASAATGPADPPAGGGDV